MRTAFTFPDDATGRILRRMQAAGDDLSRARPIEFCFLFTEEAGARAFAQDIVERGSSSAVSPYEGATPWQVVVTDTLVPQHGALIERVRRLTLLAEDRGGSPDGWGCTPME